jgi:hypothetical protein
MINFVNLNNDTFIYFLGWYWADGWGKTNAISCKYEDMVYMEKWIESHGFTVKKHQRMKNGKPWGSLQGIVYFSYSDFNKKFLSENGFNTKSKDSPQIILSKISKEKHHLFWRGFFDGDGHIQVPTKNRRKKEVAFWGTIDQDWCLLVEVLNNLDIKHIIRTYQRKCGDSSCVVFYKYDDIIKFSDYIYKGYDSNPIGMKRKWDKFHFLKSKGKKEKTSSMKGVCFNKKNGYWKATLLQSETKIKEKHIGWYKTEKEAMKARMEAVCTLQMR